MDDDEFPLRKAIQATILFGFYWRSFSWLLLGIVFFLERGEGAWLRPPTDPPPRGCLQQNRINFGTASSLKKGGPFRIQFFFLFCFVLFCFFLPSVSLSPFTTTTTIVPSRSPNVYASPVLLLLLLLHRGRQERKKKNKRNKTQTAIIAHHRHHRQGNQKKKNCSVSDSSFQLNERSRPLLLIDGAARKFWPRPTTAGN